MSTFGDGSDGALNITSGTSYLNLNQKYQFSSINIAVGATLSTTNTTGSVMYILCNGTAVIDGLILLYGRVDYGNYSWGVTIDGESFTSPGVASGANGDKLSAYHGDGGLQNGGFGGGGGGGSANTTSYNAYGGNGANGAVTFGSGGSGGAVDQLGPGYTTANGNNGSGSGGGGGGAIGGVVSSGSIVIRSLAQGGTGGINYGANGSDGTGSWVHLMGTGSASYYYDGGGGGGAGGRAGRAGVHLVLKAKNLIINGTLLTYGFNGGNGGNGGKRFTSAGYFGYGGSPGGGGGGGSGGNAKLVYDTISSTVTFIGNKGLGGSGGLAYLASSSFVRGYNGANGNDGSLYTVRVAVADGSASGGGEGTILSEHTLIEIESGASGGGSGSYITNYQALPQKDYEYRVFTHEGAFVGVWQKITSEFEYSQAINQNASEMKVSLGRSPENRIAKIETVLDDGGDPVLDENSSPILVQTETINTVGEGTDVEYNYNVDILAFYGGYEALLDSNGEIIQDTDSDPILVQYGFPNGRRVYSGYIGDYELTYGKEAGVDVTLIPHATEMSHYVFKNALDQTTVEFNSADPVFMAREAMDDYISQGGVITYTDASMPLSGDVSSYDFKLQTTREAIDKTIEFLPAGYYHFVHPGENIQYLLQKSEEADHVFYYEKHITQLRLKKSITQLVNKSYLIGGDIGAGDDLYVYQEDATSISNIRPGLSRQADSRVTDVTSGQALAQRPINEFKEPRWRTSLTITDAVYDIEDINLGQNVAFKNFGTVADTVVLQIVNIKRSKHSITMDLDTIISGQAKRLEEIKRNILSQEVKAIPDEPV